MRALLVATLLGLAMPARAEAPPILPPSTSSTLLFRLVGSRPHRPSAVGHRPSNNPHGDLDLACERCHTDEGWDTLRRPLLFDHDDDTAFALMGRHAQAACRSCHVDLRFDGPDVTADACASCHLDVHRGQLGADCQQCHTTQDFHLVRGVEIHARTAFPLTGSHLQVACEACHGDAAFGADADGAFAPLDPSCFACHASDYHATASSVVDHAAAGFPTACDACHNTLSFGTGAAFDHAAISGGFQLLGAHAAAECTACHAPGGLALLFQPSGQDDCFACHEADYEATASAALVDHPAAGLPTDCQQCHTVETWEGATFDHASTGFPLIGAHLAVACETCHRGPGFSIPQPPASVNDCVACHAEDHQEAHPAFPTTCTDCHTTQSFTGATFDHAAASGGFDLLGAHVSLDCAACHVGPDFEPIWTPSGEDDCFTCHAEDHEAAHAAFPTTCLDCHTTSAFLPATLDHSRQTDFPLVGAHVTLDCSACHTLPDFGLIHTPSNQDDCLACHQEDHQAAHPSFPTTCLGCHTTTTFDGAAFDHGQQTGFDLVGVHTSLDCAACHTIPDFDPIYDPSSPNDCFACHEDEHQQAHPDFPTTCLDCHDPDTWEGATFEHPYFPIYSGRHEGTWSSCQTCHTQPSNYEVFSCLTCHEHNRKEMDDEHEDVAGYVYESQACYACHPDGED